MKALRSAVIEEDGKRYVEIDLAESDVLDGAQEWIRFRVAIEPRGFPRVPACLEETLQRAQNLVAAETHRISQTGPWHLGGG